MDGMSGRDRGRLTRDGVPRGGDVPAAQGQTARMDTPIFDGVLGDRLAQARAEVERAERDAQAFAAAQSHGQAQALEQLARTRADALVRERTATLTARIAVLEAELRQVRGAQAVRPPATEVRPASGPVPDVAAAAAVPLAAAPAAPPAVPRTTQPAVPRISPPASTPGPPSTPAAARNSRPTPARTGRLAADAGPTGEDVPTVPSMKDIFASSRAAGWLDSLLGARR